MSDTVFRRRQRMPFFLFPEFEIMKSNVLIRKAP